MAGEHRALRVMLLGALASCAAPAWRDLSDPPTAEDLAALPAEVTKENSRRVVRRCLQRHAVAERNAHHRYGYVFREAGFIQIYTLHAMGQGRDRHVRTYVDFAEIESASSEIRFDSALLRHRVEVTLRGKFRRWETTPSPYDGQPPLDGEPRLREESFLVLVFDDADAAAKLCQAVIP